MQEAIHISGIRKSYNKGGVVALDNLSLSIEAGNIIALVGSSGSGKTTLLRLISGFEEPDAGEIRIGKKIICNQNFSIPPENRNVGVVFQEYALFPHLSIRENISFGINTYTKKEQRKRVEWLADMAEITPFLHRYPHEISAGEQQRVALLRALAPNPSIVLMDEPFNGLDTPLKSRLLPLVLNILRTTKTSTLIVTHDREETFMLADKITLLQEGRIRQHSSPQELYEEPADSYAADFFGATNKLPIHINNNTLHCALGSIPFSQLRKEPTTDNIQQSVLLIRPSAVIVQEPEYDTPPTACSHLRTRAILDKKIYYGSYSIARLHIINQEYPALYIDAHIPLYTQLKEKKEYNVFVQKQRYHVITSPS